MRISYSENDHGDMKQSMISEFVGILNTMVEYLVCGEIRFRVMDQESAEALYLLLRMDGYTRGGSLFR